MKICPQCHREYSNETLNFCLDDGEWLIEASESGEPLTAILSSEAQTRVHGVPESSAVDGPMVLSRRRSLTIGAIGILIIAAFGIGAYWLYGTRSSDQIESIAVLPFENGSGDPTMDYLSDGLSEGLIDKLSQLPQLKVTARASSFKFRGPDLDLHDIASRLGVQAVVMGKIAKVGDSLVVRVEMVDAAANRQVWSAQFNRKVSDLLSIQSEIAESASQRLRSHLSGAERQQIVKIGTNNQQAYDLLLKGRYQKRANSIEELKASIATLEQAVAIDPNFAEAHAELSIAYRQVGGPLEDPKLYLPKSESAANRAVEIDPSNARAHSALGSVYRDAWRWADAERKYRTAIQLNPNLAGARLLYATYLSNLGRHEEALSEARIGYELDPLTVENRGTIVNALINARRFDDAIEEARRYLPADKINTRFLVCRAYYGKRMPHEAWAECREGVRLAGSGDLAVVKLETAYFLARTGDQAGSLEALRKVSNEGRYLNPVTLSRVYVALGDKENALRYLEKAFDDRHPDLLRLKVAFELDPLRDDPRFQDLVRKVGLTE